MLQSKQCSTTIGCEATHPIEAVLGRAEELLQLSAHLSKRQN